MTLIKPFAALRPNNQYVAEVIAPPYDVVNRSEATALVEGNPWSFLHISKPEIDLPTTTDPYDSAVYQMGKKNFDRLLMENILKQDSTPNYYLYRLTHGDHQQTGLVCAASIKAYQQNRIKKHELTRPPKVTDRMRQIQSINAQSGPVMLACKPNDDINTIVSDTENATLLYDLKFQTARQQLWAVNDVKHITETFDQLPELYIADGHHRTEAASELAKKHNEDSYQYFLAVIFPADQLNILSYNRCVSELNGHSKDSLLTALAHNFDVTPVEPTAPKQPHQFSMYLEKQWYQLDYKDNTAQLDVDLLQTTILKPLFDIDDPREDERLRFVGGNRGLLGLQLRVDQGTDKIAFALHPTQTSELIAISDAGSIMPPKSTWFEPKLADGLFIRTL